MKQHNDHYQVIPFPKMRRLEAVMFRTVRRRPMMHGLLEVDVTRARAYLRAHKANTGEALSFTGFIITCLAKAVDEHKAVQAIRKGRKHLIFFEDVDVLTYIERDVAGQKHIRPCIIRVSANLALQIPLVDAGKLSTAGKEVPGDGKPLGGWDV
jgi:pyruvate/2-oxoglutarate dehydrogenase complex dihydrolipoamide acyltransferase (E2) component